MRILMAALVVCLGMVGVHAAAHHEIKKDQTTSGGKNAVPVPPGGGGGHRQSTSAIGPAPGVDFLYSQLDLAHFPARGISFFKWIKPGTFMMGSTDKTDPDRWFDEVQHTVTLTDGFWLLDHEVTQREYEWLMRTNRSFFKGDPARPVENVSWDDAVAFCEELTKLDRQRGVISKNQKYRLPTEAEWEYAARAGTTGVRYGELDAIAWYRNNSGQATSRSGTTHAVKRKQANAFGLYDMMGNVFEWCSDLYDAYPTRNVTNPVGAKSGFYRVFRGGDWAGNDIRLRSARRDSERPSYRSNQLGFRPALSSVR